MNSRVTNPESYIFSAIIYIGKDNFTSNEVAKILIERFSLPKNYLKAKAFAYNQIQGLVRKGLLNKVKKLGAYQYLYSATSEFNVVKENVELIEAPKKSPCQFISSATSHEHSNVNIQIRTLIEKYSSELEKVSGAKEIYEELIIAVPSRENEFRKLSLEQEKKQIKINEKINNPNFNCSSPINECIPTSNATVAVRGIANSGPIVRYSRQVKTMEYRELTGLPISYKLSLSERAEATIPNTGNPTPVIKNPMVASGILLPAACPIFTGKIKLPAPKNSPNNNEPINMFCLKFSLSFKSSPP